MARSCFLVILLLIAYPAYAKSDLVKTHAPVELERVIDGDTFAGSRRKIRLWGIDAPEKDEPEYLAATLYLEVIL